MGEKPQAAGGPYWLIAVSNPRGEGYLATFSIPGQTYISTSGDNQRFFDYEGARYHHIIDPRTGHSAGEVRSVTVIGRDATTTDGLSTAVFVMGPERGLELVERLGDVDAVIVRRDGKVLYSSGLAPP